MRRDTGRHSVDRIVRLSSLCEAIGILLASSKALNLLFEGFPNSFCSRQNELAKWFIVHNSATIRTDKFLLLEPRKFVCEAISAALAAGGQINTCSGFLGIGEDLCFRIDVSHMDFSFLPNVPHDLPRKAGGRGALAARVPACRG